MNAYRETKSVEMDSNTYERDHQIPAEQDKMRAAGRLAASVLDMIEPFVQPGVTTEELDKRCHDFIVE